MNGERSLRTYIEPRMFLRNVCAWIAWPVDAGIATRGLVETEMSSAIMVAHACPGKATAMNDLILENIHKPSPSAMAVANKWCWMISFCGFVPGSAGGLWVPMGRASPPSFRSSVDLSPLIPAPCTGG